MLTSLISLTITATLAFAVGEHVVEQSGLAGAKEAGQNGHRKTFTHEVTLARNENRSGLLWLLFAANLSELFSQRD